MDTTTTPRAVPGTDHPDPDRGAKVEMSGQITAAANRIDGLLRDLADHLDEMERKLDPVLLHPEFGEAIATLQKEGPPPSCKVAEELHQHADNLAAADNLVQRMLWRVDL